MPNCPGFEILTAASVHLYYDLAEIQPDDKRHFQSPAPEADAFYIRPLGLASSAFDL